MQGLDFIAIDFETATGKRDSICEAGICVVRNAKIAETRSWLIRPKGNLYSYWNMQIHGITPDDTASSPEFPDVWAEISRYLDECPILVAHNAAFDISCIRNSLELYGLEKLNADYYCSLRVARRVYDFECNTLDFLCRQFEIPCKNHHRAGDDAEMCARLFLRELKDAKCDEIEELKGCGGHL